MLFLFLCTPLHCCNPFSCFIFCLWDRVDGNTPYPRSSFRKGTANDTPPLPTAFLVAEVKVDDDGTRILTVRTRVSIENACGVPVRFVCCMLTLSTAIFHHTISKCIPENVDLVLKELLGFIQTACGVPVRYVCMVTGYPGFRRRKRLRSPNQVLYTFMLLSPLEWHELLGGQTT